MKETSMEYPLEMRTRRALGVLGRLIFDWAENPARLPPEARREPGRIVIDLKSFRQVMDAEGLTEGDPGDSAAGDYAVRADVREVELIVRTPDRASILLPEPHVVTSYRGAMGPVEAPVVRLYKELADALDAGGDADLTAARGPDDPVVYGKVQLGKDPLEAFIYPNTAYYSCTQCL
jgi:hypothetical protein